MIKILLVLLGGGVGAVLRGLITNLFKKSFPKVTFPLATTVVNLVGCFLIGYISQFDLNDSLKTLIVTGMLGGLTTFSTMMYELIQMLNDDNKPSPYFYIYALVQFVLGLLCCLLGYYV
ncbi:fluoride efflux transporter FluC [Staphylococcus massiliensis]|uniref:Fluoride-specific ion channel FluC n=1 Tax=Staphylococcus massiliensis S46 TaxID=1229783 RepID=K9AW41_9STAP|nr:CrcB family protein [Staphylococcus massiliensis]EKU50296.1 CrcB-like protein [Staphylococcus massiliensis S46]MCG3399678.1 CrcB family protein [Staphylococcus massiliensis]MCG3400783.1 CrcB family protein [Staphylococcus massiliensis]MCG3412053.1 CrcB family protein [Staphylococcus massiliensis]PNZ99045.1 CrcB family protein [Staphylococcus massiliensis CCUG 55927]